MRRTAYYKVSEEGRDQGKTYLITEMPATQAELLATRAFLAMSRGGVEIPDDVAATGMAGIAKVGLGLLAKIPFEDAKPIMEEMMACVRIVPDENKPDFSRPLVENDIEEIKTRLKLRMEVFKLHTDFLKAVGTSTSASAASK